MPKLGRRAGKNGGKYWRKMGKEAHNGIVQSIHRSSASTASGWHKLKRNMSKQTQGIFTNTHTNSQPLQWRKMQGRGKVGNL